MFALRDGDEELFSLENAVLRPEKRLWYWWKLFWEHIFVRF